MNDTLRVPTVALDAEIVCADGTWFVGRIFLPAASEHHSGAMRPDEWMNDASPFFPFLPANASEPVILNKTEVVVLTVPEEAHPPEEDMGNPVRRVQVECRERTLSGNVIIDMPEGHQRVLDYLNRPEAFLIVHDGDRTHLVRKARITRVLEPREA
ncbi:MAG: hypothetical protein DMF78_02275 [Acidobacteria bacterium]|nr:MAG: hypothetical protein DMF78_02275 [Acidobacteriota bacterium]